MAYSLNNKHLDNLLTITMSKFLLLLSLYYYNCHCAIKLLHFTVRSPRRIK